MYLHGNHSGVNCQLMCFCDASAKAHAFVIYLSFDAGVNNLLFSKPRVAPIKKLDIYTLIGTSSSSYWCTHAQLCARATLTPCGKEVPLDRQSMYSSLDYEQEAINNFRSESSQGYH